MNKSISCKRIACIILCCLIISTGCRQKMSAEVSKSARDDMQICGEALSFFMSELKSGKLGLVKNDIPKGQYQFSGLFNTESQWRQVST